MRLEVLPGRDVDTSIISEIMHLRQLAYGEDSWSNTDRYSQHLLARDGKSLLGYYRILHWNSLGVGPALVSVSPLNAVYDVDFDGLQGFEILELGRLCVRAEARRSIVPRLLWSELVQFSAGFARPVLGVGMITPTKDDALSAEADYSLARSLAPCGRTQKFVPKVPLFSKLGPSGTYFGPNAGMQQAKRINSSVVRAYMKVGARFGQCATWSSFGDRPCMLATVTRDELRI